MRDDLSKFDKIKTLNELVWENKASMPSVDGWLESFKGFRELTPEEECNLLFALENFLYYGSRLIRELLKAVYRDLYRYNIIETIRCSNGGTLDANFIENKVKEELSRTRFLGVGNPSESGVHLLYFFRQENCLSKDYFINQDKVFKHNIATKKYELRSPELKHYVFIDDFCGSGDQATTYLKETVDDIKSLNKDANVSYYCLFGTSLGLKVVRDETKLDSVEATYEFDESFKIFSKDSRFFEKSSCPEEVKKDLLESICREFGLNLGFSHDECLGYSDGQLMVGFHHNTPDNTLPIFWHLPQDGSWWPIFKRYNKLSERDDYE